MVFLPFVKMRITMVWLVGLVMICGIFFSFGQTEAAMDKFFSRPTMDLMESLMRGDQASATIALKAGANVNEVGLKGITPLIYSVIKLNRHAVAELLSLGADPNPKQEDGYNALTAAYKLVSLDPAILEMLINSGKCDLNVLMPDDEPLMFYLAASGHIELLKLALKNGANPSLLTRSKRPLIIEVVWQEEYDAAQLLLDAGASVFATDSSGESLLEWVREGASQEISPNGVKNKSRLRLLERLEKVISK